MSQAVTLLGSKDGRSISHPKQTTRTTYTVLVVCWDLRTDRRHFSRNTAPAKETQGFCLRFFWWHQTLLLF